MNTVTPKLIPFSLQGTPSLIEKAWPTSKISAETQKERKAGSGQTLTGLGSYWKGRKPLILTRACLLATLMPATDDLERDVEIFEMLMGFDDQAMARRLPGSKQGLMTTGSYAEQVFAAKRPETVPESELLEGIWDKVNAHLGTHATTINELVEQLGILRYGRRPKFADTFSGSGSIPFEAARMGCDVFASDLNPIACMLTWGAFNVVGASPERHAEMKAESEEIIAKIDREICDLGIEHDEQGNRGKVYLYCLETRCPRTGYMVPMAPSWVISKKRNIIARLVPDEATKRYDIEILSGVSKDEMDAANKGTVQKGRLHHPMLSDPLGVPIKEIRGDYKDEDGKNRNKLRPWGISDIRARPDDIWQERLYAIQWMDAEDIAAGKANPRTWFAAPTPADLDREEEISELVEKNLSAWQEAGIVPDMKIEPGNKTDEPIRTRGWTHWHHLFNPRHLLVNGVAAKHCKENAQSTIGFCSILNRMSRLAMWNNTAEKTEQVFSNQALNTNINYPSRSWHHVASLMSPPDQSGKNGLGEVVSQESKEVYVDVDIYITDPPYADAVQYDEITEYFISWLRTNSPQEFSEWLWDSRRNLAIKGDGHSFKEGMVSAYGAMTGKMTNDGVHIVQFTHTDGKVWSDMAHIFWGSGLQVVNDWYVATETESGLKEGGHVKGSHIIVLKKRQGEKSGWSDEIVHDIRDEVADQVNEMIGLNQRMLGSGRDENIFNDADLQMAGYAAALRVLTSYTEIDGVDMTREAMRERKKGGKSVVDDLIEYAVQVANEQLVPDGMKKNLWDKLESVDRYFLKMLDMESQGHAKLDDFQNFAKAFRIKDYGAMMQNVRPNTARLKDSYELNRSEQGQTEFGGSLVRHALFGINQIRRDVDSDEVRMDMHARVSNYMAKRELMIGVISFIAETNKFRNEPEASAARILADVLLREKIG
ncbi:MAG: anti-phage-associated DUF1156 domain-containing protein [Roseibium sp.]|uniref:anti-phage-associated DUF1156 domain-containing protein n=1 Tax=Roseibium sp. TaxID=1936156 RepID=UPI0032985156